MSHKALKTILVFSALIFGAFIFGGKTEALNSAALYLSPSSGTYTVGNTFSIQIKVNSGGVAINAADGILVYDPNALEVKTVSKNDSIFALWVQEPIFANSQGTINFAGGKPSPGYSGAAGTIATIVFKAKTAGSTRVNFASASVLADDGKGTNVLANLGSGFYKLTEKEILPIPPEEVPPTPDKAPAAPIVESLTHPDENKWYPNNNPELHWKLPSDVTGVSLLFDQNPLEKPGDGSDGLFQSKTYESVADGVWYFHIKFRNSYGWGSVTHRKVLIDTRPPEPFSITVDNEDDLTNPVPLFKFLAKDSPSGVDYYEINIDKPEGFSTTTKETSLRPLPIAPAKHSVEIKAFDKAGNFTAALADFEILPIEPPAITKIPRRITIGEVLEIEGEALPEFTVRIYIQRLGKESLTEKPILEKVKVDPWGRFALSYDRVLSKGDYNVWAQSEDKRGALSLPTKNYPLEVGLPPFLKFGKMALDYLTTVITLLLLIVGAIALIFYIWYQISLWRKRLRKETSEVKESVTRAFRALREEVQEQIEYLDQKRGLTKAEKQIRDKLKEALDVSEEFIAKEIRDVEKEVE